ncbi:hypothetical protein HNR60_002996 [Rhodopseudomonas rhenobacensis]|uniref:Uncharacterized protein n=1 Tax=Rhodopseudomonas rhenobacensis TaxID=87461 RepID=A0A7W7Z589_9BRAD|nr:hypothetical protein [Rhodopseudomonas rhenobacensis]MBB5048234.1 hypothetical protein [Rhodopseudomonas rhenobacensis]
MKRMLIATAVAGFLGLGLMLPAAAMPVSGGLAAAATTTAATDNVVEAQYGRRHVVRRGYYGPRPGMRRGYGPRPGMYRGHRGPGYGMARGRHRGWR